MDMLIRVNREHAYETGVILNKYKVKFTCDIPEFTDYIRYRIEGVHHVFMSGEQLNFCDKDCNLITLDNIKSMLVFC